MAHSEKELQRPAMSRKRGTSTDCDMRLPEETNTSDQPRQSYYGHNFQQSEQGRSSSFTFGDIKKQQLPDPWVKAPDPYPERTQKDYDAYKAAGKHLAAVRREYADTNPLSPKNASNMQCLKEGERLAGNVIVAANNIVAARSGFDHKYPTAYESLDFKHSHENAARESFNTARKFRGNRDKICHRIEKLENS
ncbi:hypothetical protein AnigIFM56816_003559 [Aspergillus niger]|nr:hypothetical protein AnigIFM50267_001979 [Aspergillus niger]GKZ79373.1 hypothetical protein AnigIFM56816_003559 [Aspergillus niger]GLA41930.1 hypothetical protein AnigIFM63309_010250 [Aspergillus niger]